MLSYPYQVYQQTNGYDCEATSIMNLLQFYKKLSPQNMTAAVEQAVENALGITNESGADDNLKKAYLKRLGFQAEVVFNGTIEDMDKLVVQGFPPIPFCKLYTAHWMVYLGHTLDGDMAFADSANNDPSKLTVLTSDNFNNLWYDDQYYTNSYGERIPGIYLKVTPIE